VTGQGVAPHLIHLVGEFDYLNLPELESRLQVCEPGSSCEIDTAGVTFFDSAAIGALVNLWHRGVRVQVVNPSATIHRVLTISGLGSVLGLHPLA